MAEKPKKRASKKKAAKAKTAKKKAAPKATKKAAQKKVLAEQQPALVRVLFVEDTTGDQFECEVPTDMLIGQLAGDFFEDRGWGTHDASGHAQRAVAELVDPVHADRTRRLSADATVDEEQLQDGDVIRIFPEAVAGADERARLPAHIQDLNGMNGLAEWNDAISFEAKPASVPTYYLVRINCPGFARLNVDRPVVTDTHEVEIHLGAKYPAEAPLVRWKTPVFHPNIHPDHQGVCLGVLMERWMPGMGIARLVTMLAEIAQWRNFDTTSSLNNAAADWARNPDHHKYIREIGGSPGQHPIAEIAELLKLFEQKASGQRERVKFTPRPKSKGPSSHE